MVAIARTKPLIVIAAALVFAKIQHFRAERHRPKRGTISISLYFVGVRRVHFRNIRRILQAISPNGKLTLAVIGRGIGCLLEAFLARFPIRGFFTVYRARRLSGAGLACGLFINFRFATLVCIIGTHSGSAISLCGTRAIALVRRRKRRNGKQPRRKYKRKEYINHLFPGRHRRILSSATLLVHDTEQKALAGGKAAKGSSER